MQIRIVMATLRKHFEKKMAAKKVYIWWDFYSM